MIICILILYLDEHSLTNTKKIMYFEIYYFLHKRKPTTRLSVICVELPHTLPAICPCSPAKYEYSNDAHIAPGCHRIISGGLCSQIPQ